MARAGPTPGRLRVSAGLPPDRGGRRGTPPGDGQADRLVPPGSACGRCLTRPRSNWVALGWAAGGSRSADQGVGSARRLLAHVTMAAPNTAVTRSLAAAGRRQPSGHLLGAGLAILIVVAKTSGRTSQFSLAIGTPGTPTVQAEGRSRQRACARQPVAGRGPETPGSSRIEDVALAHSCAQASMIIRCRESRRKDLVKRLNESEGGPAD